MSKRFDFGRVFFPNKDSLIPNRILFQPLGNHVANVRKLVWYWNPDDFVKGDWEASRKRVADAAYLHDIGKPQKFGISINVKANGEIEFSYSFRGHRFEAIDPEQPWVEFLAKGHHDYSAHDICRDTYKLKTLTNNLKNEHPLKLEAEKYKQILAVEPLAYAHELYILEMCDQIEAEIACQFFKDDDQAESRAFMDFTITRNQAEKNVFFIDPWIFGNNKQEFTLTLASWSMSFPKDIIALLEKGTRDNQTLTKQLQNQVKDWWFSQPRNLKSVIDKVIIRRLTKDELDECNAQTIYETVGRFLPNPMQEKLAVKLNQKQNPNPALLLKSPTGTGKTESILFPALANDYRLILVLPTRSLLEDQRERTNKYLMRFSGLPQNKDREISLVVDTGAIMTRWLYVNEEVSKPKVNPRRHLYKGNIILTTLDKFLYRYFSFGDKQKSFIFPHRIHRERTLICFDEAHSYDKISFTNFQCLVQSLYEAGRSLVLMSATMPKSKQLSRSFDYLEEIDFIDNSELANILNQFQQKMLKRPYLNKRSLEWLSHIKHNSDVPEKFQYEFAQLVIREWQAKPTRRILAVVETVRDAVAIYRELKDQLKTNIDSQERFLFLYHGRIADNYRTDLYKHIQQRDSNQQPYILITTSAIEVGCDLNAEILISQICPPENLIQRAGRCNRRGNVPDAKVIVVGDCIPEFVNSLDKAGWQKYQKTLRSLTAFNAQAIGECISQSQNIDDYRVVELFSMLHDYVYRADLTCQPAYEKGLVVTRSWTPSATLVYDNGESSNDISKMPQVTVPVDRLVIRKEIGRETSQYRNKYSGTSVYEQYYDQEQARWNLKPLWWGSAYSKDIIVKIGPYSDGAFMPDEGIEYEYEDEFGFVELPGVFIRLRPSGFDEKLLYQFKEGDAQRSAIISYTKALDREPPQQQSQELAPNAVLT